MLAHIYLPTLTRQSHQRRSDGPPEQSLLDEAPLLKVVKPSPHAVHCGLRLLLSPPPLQVPGLHLSHAVPLKP